jgi:hypothetical protein
MARKARFSVNGLKPSAPLATVVTIQCLEKDWGLDAKGDNYEGVAVVIADHDIHLGHVSAQCSLPDLRTRKPLARGFWSRRRYFGLCSWSCRRVRTVARVPQTASCVPIP